jgi:L-ribulose-5-phosphate 3-epimerase
MSAGKAPRDSGAHHPGDPGFLFSGAPFRIGYNTNGFAHHRLEDAIRILSELGYGAVAITPDVHHLPPFETSADDLRRLRTLLESLELQIVIETGARYVLDPRRKHRPNLLERDAAGRERRLAFLIRCAELVTDLGGDTISTWSGTPPAETEPTAAEGYLLEGVERVCRRAAELGVRVAFEPEPGMLVSSLADWTALHDSVAAPNLGLTLDVGHVPCSESISPAEAVRRHAAELINIHLDDSRGGVHEHLQVGDGELDWSEIARALWEIGFTGIAAFELSRHSHAAPDAARTALDRFSASAR